MPRFYYDEQGRYRGHSSGLATQAFKGLFAVFTIAFVIGFPLLIHGPVGVILEGVWIALLAIVGFFWMASKAAPKGGHHAGRGDSS